MHRVSPVRDISPVRESDDSLRGDSSSIVGVRFVPVRFTRQLDAEDKEITEDDEIAGNEEGAEDEGFTKEEEAVEEEGPAELVDEPMDEESSEEPVPDSDPTAPAVLKNSVEPLQSVPPEQSAQQLGSQSTSQSTSQSPPQPEQPTPGDVPAAPDAPPAPKNQGADGTVPDENSRDAVTPEDWATRKHIRFSFRFQPWKEVIPWFANLADLSLEMNSFPPGTLNLTDPAYYTAEEALDVLNGILLFKEYTLIRKGRMLFVLYLPDGIPPNLLDPITPAELDKRGKYELVRVLFNLNRTTPELIQAEIEKMLGQQGAIVVLPKSQQILITETAGTLRAIRDVIKRIDDPTDQISSAINVIEMRNMSADEALAILRKLIGIEENDPSLRTAVDATGSKIWMTGRADMIERAKEIIKTIDEAYDISQTKLGDPQFDIYECGSADPNTVLAVLQTLLVGIPDVRLSIDPKTGGIAVLARVSEHKTVKSTIAQMQLAAPTIEVIPLNRLSPTTAAESIRKLLAPSESSSGSSTTRTANAAAQTPAMIEPDTANRQLIVRGTPSQIAEIRTFLLKLGEAGISPTAVKDERTIRQIPLSPAASSFVLEQLREIWGTTQPNELKVVTPSAIVPSRITTEPGRRPGTPSVEPPSAPLRERHPDFRPPLREQRERLRDDKEEMRQILHDTFQQQAPATGPTTRRDVQPVYRPVQFSQPVEETEGADTAALKAEVERLRDLLQRQNAQQPQHPQSWQQSVPPHVEQPVPQSASAAPPVVVSVAPGGLMISSEDPEALTRLEALIRMISDESVLTSTSLAIYYLKNSTAEVVKQNLEAVLGSGSSGMRAGAGNLPNLEADGSPAIASMLPAGASYEATGTVQITAEARLNALFIQANPVDHRTIEKLLPLFDQPEPPGGDPLNKARPHLIPLQNIRAEDAMNSVKEVFAAQMQSGTGAAGGRQGQRGGTNMPMPPGGMPPEMMQAVMARMGGGQQGGRMMNRRAVAKEEEPKMTLSVDENSNALIVNAPESLFTVVEAYVLELDNAAGQRDYVTESYTPRNASTDLIKNSLPGLSGGSVEIGSTNTSAPKGAIDGTTGTSGTGNRWGGTGGFNRTGGGFGGIGFPMFGGGGFRPGGPVGGMQFQPQGFGGTRQFQPQRTGGGTQNRSGQYRPGR